MKKKILKIKIFFKVLWRNIKKQFKKKKPDHYENIDAYERDNKKVRQYTKCLVTFLTIMACIWITTSYVFSGIALFKYGNVDLLTSLSEKTCETIIGIVIVYALKAFFESHTKANDDLKRDKFEYMNKMNFNDDDGTDI